MRPRFLILPIIFLTVTIFGQPPAPPKSEQWNVSHQLIFGMPWGSEKKSEAKLLTDVKEAEATPDERLVLALNDLAAWYRGQKKYPEAEKTYQSVLKLQVDRMGQHHDVALTHNDLGVLYTESNRYPEAEKEFKEALELWKTKWDMPLRTEDEAVTFHNYAVLLAKVGRGGEAKSMEEKADAIMAERRKAMGM